MLEAEFTKVVYRTPHVEILYIQLPEEDIRDETDALDGLQHLNHTVGGTVDARNLGNLQSHELVEHFADSCPRMGNRAMQNSHRHVPCNLVRFYGKAGPAFEKATFLGMPRLLCYL